MVKHIVFFSLVDAAEGKSKAEHAQIIKKELENLTNFIPEIVSMEVGVNHPDASELNFDMALYSQFESMEDLNTYVQHPEHKRVAAYIAKVRTKRAAVDYVV